MYVFPDDWSQSKSAVKKKRKTEAGSSIIEETHEQSSSSSSQKKINNTTFTEDKTDKSISPIVSEIVKSIQNTKSTPAVPVDFNLDVILTHVSFCEILNSLFHENNIDKDVNIPIVSKIYEESFMREAFSGERECAAGSMCECNFIDPLMAFTGVEFLVPGESPGEHPKLCVLCSRKVTQKLFYDILFTGKEYKGCIQRYGNICNTPKEYARDCMLICPSHVPMHYMPYPMMSHQRNKYETYISNGYIRAIRQLKVSYEDFCTPLTKE
jgi:hypothetical protein